MALIDNIRKEIYDALELAKAEIAANIDTEGLTASGRTANSMLVSSTEKGAELTGRKAFYTLEHGRGAGNVPANMVDIIIQWAIDKGIQPIQREYTRQPSERWQPKYSVAERSLKMFAGAVSYNIKTKGTQLFQEGGKETVYTPVIDDIVNKLQYRVANIVFNHINQNVNYGNNQ